MLTLVRRQAHECMLIIRRNNLRPRQKVTSHRIGEIATARRNFNGARRCRAAFGTKDDVFLQHRLVCKRRSPRLEDVESAECHSLREILPERQVRRCEKLAKLPLLGLRLQRSPVNRRGFESQANMSHGRQKMLNMIKRRAAMSFLLRQRLHVGRMPAARRMRSLPKTPTAAKFALGRSGAIPARASLGRVADMRQVTVARQARSRAGLSIATGVPPLL